LGEEGRNAAGSNVAGRTWFDRKGSGFRKLYTCSQDEVVQRSLADMSSVVGRLLMLCELYDDVGLTLSAQTLITCVTVLMADCQTSGTYLLISQLDMYLS
jgi:hypothetical protein